MIIILAIVSALWSYSLTMAIILVVIVLYTCVAYKVKQGDKMAE